jgi:hypothetical protein
MAKKKGSSKGAKKAKKLTAKKDVSKAKTLMAFRPW